MDCTLCKRPIKNYNTEFNNMKIDDSCSVDICGDCTDKFMKWQRGIFAKIYPTKTMKKMYGKKD